MKSKKLPIDKNLYFATLYFVSSLDLQSITPPYQKMKKATRQHTKEHNRILVLKTIFDNESISRADIARATSLTRTTVTEIVAALLDENLVTEIGIGESQGGKSPILLKLAEDSRYLLSLDLSHSEFRGAVINLRGKILATASLPVSDRGGEEALGLVYKILDQLVEAGYQPLVGIGVGTPGLVNGAQGIVIKAVNLDWENLPLAHLLESRYHLPVYVMNDSQAAAMGEYHYGQGHLAESNLVVINARHGLGAGIIIQGRLFQGDGGGAGEIGHVVVQEDGSPCRCGNYGCLETVASVQAILKKAKQLAPNHPLLPHNPDEISLATVQQAFSAGDPQIQQIVFESGRYLGIAISALVGMLNIQNILLTGDMTCFGEPWLKSVHEAMFQHTLAGLANESGVHVGQLGKDSILLGASAVLINQYSLLFRGE
jgi:N-acetylglucosamine repressor